MLLNECYGCDSKDAIPWQNWCASCSAGHKANSDDTITKDDYQDWLINSEFHTNHTDNYSAETSYHTCIRCGELVSGVERSVRHWESNHMNKVFPDGFPYEIVAD